MTAIYLFRTALKDLLLPGKALTGLLLALVPPFIALLWRLAAQEDFSAELAYNLLSVAFVFGFVMVILSVVTSTGVIAQEIEQKTIMYLLTRPVPRWRIALVKFAAAVLVTTGTAWLSCILLALVVYGPAGLGGSPRLLTSQLKDGRGLVLKMKNTEDTLSLYLRGKLPQDLQGRLDAYEDEAQGWKARRQQRELLREVVSGINRSIESEPLYARDRFEGVTLAPRTQELLAQNPQGSAALALNRALLEDAYPELLSHYASSLPTIERDLLILPLGALTYGALFLLLATLMNRPLIFGLLFAFGWETWVPSLPIDFQKLSVMAYLRVLSPHLIPGSTDRGANAALAIFNPATISRPFAWGVTIGIIVIGLLTALLAFSTREYVPREDL